jgi:hypothetical protein
MSVRRNQVSHEAGGARPDVSAEAAESVLAAGSTQRYKVDANAQLWLKAEVLHGMQTLNAYLKSRKRARIPLPEVCGYIPLVEELFHYLYSRSEGGWGFSACGAIFVSGLSLSCLGRGEG